MTCIISLCRRGHPEVVLRQTAILNYVNPF
ncbi:hypothetical protein SAMN05519103_00911 [Rhizobiales bacterium GAS113]|nr:hypothetical protein SAMN05519103_00911 [Rhizobiales bacterium GAS113]